MATLDLNDQIALELGRALMRAVIAEAQRDMLQARLAEGEAASKESKKKLAPPRKPAADKEG